MQKINFVNGQSPALNANNLNLMQTNAENAINDVNSAIKNGVLTIQKNGSNVATFGANSSSNVTANITVPTVNNATLTIQKNGSTVASFTSNASSNVTANISVPTNNDINTLINNKIKYGTSLPSSADNGTIFILYS